MKRILTSKEYRFIKGLKELMTKYNAVISTDAQGKIEIVVNEDDESFDFETESTIYLGECFSDDELNELLEKNLDDNNTLETANFPPSLYGNGRVNPTQNLVDAFPMANGYPISETSGNYDAENPYDNRDPRLAKYIVYNGSKQGPSDTEIITGTYGTNTDVALSVLPSTQKITIFDLSCVIPRLVVGLIVSASSFLGGAEYTPLYT